MKDIKQKAEEYAELELKVMKFDAMDLKWQFIKAVLYGAKLATQWNRPNEKPKRFGTRISKDILFCENGVIHFGYYDYKYELWTEHWPDSQFKTIDGWQYLPSIK